MNSHSSLSLSSPYSFFPPVFLPFPLSLFLFPFGLLFFLSHTLYHTPHSVRIVPEFDLPAHMASWAQGYPSLITDCPTYNPHPEWPRYYSPADVTNEQLYKVLDVVLTELKDIFVDQHWHVGGDEPHYQCWDLNEKIVNYKMKQGNWTNNQLYSYFSHRYGAIVRNHNKSRIGWDEMYTIGGKMPPTPGHDDDDSIVHVWTDNTKLEDIVQAGKKMLYRVLHFVW